MEEVETLVGLEGEQERSHPEVWGDCPCRPNRERGAAMVQQDGKRQEWVRARGEAGALASSLSMPRPRDQAGGKLNQP